MRWQRQRSLETVMDPHLKGKYSLESMERAEKCLADEWKNRPTMGEVLWHLDQALGDLEEREAENRQFGGNCGLSEATTGASHSW
ncbi:hypothetical protein CRYUN_Cryun34aG0111100 [Craigia yunnanensis]